MSPASFPADQYQLLDFGEGRKLERFGKYLLDRPSPAAAAVRQARPSLWSGATAGYWREKGTQGFWQPAGTLPGQWTLSRRGLKFQLQASPFGHLGLFPEQAPCWDWIAERVQAAGRPLVVLNLFAYTGGSTLAAAQAGASVVHVDAARNMVTRARENARASRLEDAPIRWICDDVLRFVRREVRRGSQYDGIIVDPPAYGHGPKGESWKLDKHLPSLLEICGCLMQRHPQFLLLTCHSAQYGAKRSSPDRRGSGPLRSANDRRRSGFNIGATHVRPDHATGHRSAEHRVTEAGLANASTALRQLMADTVPAIELPDVEWGPLGIESTTGRRLSCGVFARWTQP